MQNKTKADIKKAALAFIAGQNDTFKDEWYFTEQDMAEIVLTQFLFELGIDLEKEE